MTFSYYNELDEAAAAWLAELIKQKLIPDGFVDTRSIWDVAPEDLCDFTQHHFFAGIGGWPLALKLAGWPEDRPVWTGSCPCQPFSGAGKGGGFADERHLWPAWFHLISQRKPGVLFGEQVEAAIGHGWLDLVQADLEGEGYACGFVGLPAAGVGAAHIRQRLWFMADSECGTTKRRGYDVAAAAGGAEGKARERERVRNEPRSSGYLGNVAHANSDRFWAWRAGQTSDGRDTSRVESAGLLSAGRSGPPDQQRPQGRQLSAQRTRELSAGTAGVAGEFWDACDWLPCLDGKARPVEPGTFPLAYGVPARVGRLRGYGNAIVPQVAAEVIRAYMSTLGPQRRTV